MVYRWTYRTPGSLFARGWTRLPLKGFSRINRIKEKIFYILSFSVNYNNCSPADGNDSQNGIHCRRRATIIYELTNNILKNNSVAQLYFRLTRIMLFSYGCERQIINNRKKCSCFAGNLDGHADQAVPCQAHRPVRQVLGYPRCHCTPPSGNYLPHIAPADAMVIDFGVKNRVVVLWNRFLKLVLKRHETDPLLSSLKRQAA